MPDLLKTAEKTKYLINKPTHKSVVPNAYARKHYVKKPISLTALKILHLLISHAAGEMSDDIQHTITFNDINHYLKKHNLTQNSIEPYFVELSETSVRFADKKTWGVSSIITEAYCTYDPAVSKYIFINYRFGLGFRSAAKEAKHYTMLDIPAMMKFKKKYSIPLYELLASYVNLKHSSTKSFTFDEIRNSLGIPKDSSYTNYQILRECIYPAMKEISRIPYIDIGLTLGKKGIKYTSLLFFFDSHYKRKNIKKDHMGDPIGTVKI